MPTCANCSAELSGDWKFCVYCGTPTVAGAVRPVAADTDPDRFNPLAILALVLACIGGFPALIFGHIAIAQIHRTGERGISIARVATVLGYVWLAAVIVITVAWFSGGFSGS